jgi:hypothetical protein
MKTFKHPTAMSVKEVCQMDRSKSRLKVYKEQEKLLGLEVVGTKEEYEILLLCPSSNWKKIADPNHIYYSGHSGESRENSDNEQPHTGYTCWWV